VSKVFCNIVDLPVNLTKKLLFEIKFCRTFFVISYYFLTKPSQSQNSSKHKFFSHNKKGLNTRVCSKPQFNSKILYSVIYIQYTRIVSTLTYTILLNNVNYSSRHIFQDWGKIFPYFTTLDKFWMFFTQGR
jgi:hypothetical protein